ncbi:hypothetical protein Sjap_018187 [Stephania japonica]|uniref:Uncharacterized protein n=1 Tax=Stephania japonica TaxID=461633 RepID=A0AAP0I7L5_9MAGN
MAAEAFVTGFLANVSSEILKKLGAFATHELGLMLGFKGELRKLKNIVEMILAVLEDAEVRQAKENAVRLWLQRLKQAVYDAEDVLDVVAYEALRRKMGRRFKNKVHKFVWLPIRLAFRLEMANKLQGIIRKLDDIAKQKNDFDLKGGQSSAYKASLNRDTSRLLNDDEVVGREVEKSKIVKMLLDDSVVNRGENFSVISIVGFGGLGKTTLAQSVYNHNEVSRCFHLTEWVCVANDRSSDKTLLTELFRNVCKSQPELSNPSQMQESLVKELQDKKFFLVLDDVWDSSQWDDNIRVILKYGAQGSKVIVTTRLEQVAREMRTSHLIRLEELSEASSWALFEKHAFGKDGPKKTCNLQVIGSEIVAKCHGVPLAVKFVGSLLYSKETFEEWKTISENLNVVGGNVRDVLMLSYHHLPSPLKQCFQYCAIFPKDARMLKSFLIHQWMAHGFIPSLDDLEMEQVGNDFFKSLCWSSFFQDMEVNENGDIISCKMHDLVHDLAQSIMQKECLFASSRADVMRNIINVGETRHLGVILDNDISINFPEDLYQAKKLRTLFAYRCMRATAWMNALMKFKFIRVLRLEGIEDVPSSICKLILLRYLYIESYSLTSLPQSISQLYYLETLSIKGCPKLEELPDDMSKLTNLRHLYIAKSTKILKKFGRLHNLRSISPILFLGEEEDGRGIGELECLNNLCGDLRIHNMERVRDVSHVRKAKLMEKGKVYELEMVWNEGAESVVEGKKTDYSEVVEALEVPPNLIKLRVNGFPGVKLPLTKWLANGSLSYLVEIKLQKCRNLEEIPPIWHIQPSLETLEISWMDKVKVLGGKCTSTRALAAPRLKHLTLRHMRVLEEWVENSKTTPNSFPFLEKLCVENCEKLSLILTSSFPPLKEIYIFWIGGLDMMCSSANNDPRRHHLPSLTSLHVGHVHEFTSLPKGFLQSSSSEHLQSVSIKFCNKFQGFVDVEGPELPLLFSSNLKKIEVCYCPNLESINVRGLTSLQTLQITAYSGLESSILGLQSLRSLKNLTLDGVPLSSGEDAICSKSLKKLQIINCSNFQGFTQRELQLLTSLEELEISSCSSLTSLELNSMFSLTKLTIRECKGIKSFPFSLEDLQCIPSLRWLLIGGFSEELDHLPFLPLEDSNIPWCSSLRFRNLGMGQDHVTASPPATPYRSKKSTYMEF